MEKVLENAIDNGLGRISSGLYLFSIGLGIVLIILGVILIFKNRDMIPGKFLFRCLKSISEGNLAIFKRLAM